MRFSPRAPQHSSTALCLGLSVQIIASAEARVKHRGTPFDLLHVVEGVVWGGFVRRANQYHKQTSENTPPLPVQNREEPAASERRPRSIFEFCAWISNLRHCGLECGAASMTLRQQHVSYDLMSKPSTFLPCYIYWVSGPHLHHTGRREPPQGCSVCGQYDAFA